MTRKCFTLLSLLALELASVSSFAASQPLGVELNPTGVSRIFWMFETPEDDWVRTCTMGEGGHKGDDYYADDWARAGAEGLTGEERTFGQIVYAGISGTAITKPNHGEYGNDVIIYDSESKFALRNAHLSEILVANGESVAAGIPIAKVGRTGNVTGSHLHVVLYKNIENADDRPITWAHVQGEPTSFAAPFLYNPRVIPGEIPEAKTEIEIEDADSVWEADLTRSEELVVVARAVSPRIIAEYTQLISIRDLAESSELSEAAKSVSPRIIAEYADSCFSPELQKSEGLENAAKSVSPRIIVEYADSYFSRNLVRFSAGGVAERTLSITSTEASPGSNVTVHLNITDAAGVTGGDILIKYDDSVLTVGEVKGTDLISGITLIANTDVPGEIKLGMAGTQGIPTGSGALVDIGLTIGADAQTGTQTTLEFTDAEMYHESGTVIPVNLENGVVKITELVGIKGDVNNDGKVRSNDAILALRIATGLMTPTDYQKWAADMNGDGRVRSNDAILILRKATGLPAPSAAVVASAGGQLTVTLAEAHGVAGESVTLPLRVDSIAGLAGGDICITYDRAVLRAVDVLSHSNVLLANNIAEPGIVHIAFASADRLDSKTIAELRFDILADNISLLKLKSVELYRPNALPIDARKIDGQFSSWAMPPERSALLQNFPNPFNPDTWIPYQLKDGSEVTIQIFSVPGDLVRELKLGYKPAGLYVSRDRAAYWDGRNASGEKAASGVYFYTIQAGDFTATKKIVVAR